MDLSGSGSNLVKLPVFNGKLEIKSLRQVLYGELNQFGDGIQAQGLDRPVFVEFDRPNRNVDHRGDLLG